MRLYVLLISLAALSNASSISFTLDSTRFDYAEVDSGGSLIDTERSGGIAGFGMELLPNEEGLYAFTHYAEGTTQYVGSLIGSSGGYGSYKSTTTNMTTNSLLGYMSTHHVTESTLEIPWHIGLGYRGWYRDLGSYAEYYDWPYLSLGVGVRDHIRNKRLAYGVDFSYNKAFGAQMYENLHGYTFDLNNVYGYVLKGELDYRWRRRLSTFIGYTYEYWSIKDSTVVGGFYEPDSTTKNEMISIGVRYHY